MFSCLILIFFWKDINIIVRVESKWNNPATAVTIAPMCYVQSTVVDRNDAYTNIDQWSNVVRKIVFTIVFILRVYCE